ncbi:14 kDa phosphohistidine phosphatase-like isoform X2 [Daktulosphaira vitifoliae]|uniref:14 kDa phosphohistidine phosphatase-like isoform X2 n=1 Tax=Daktulosphaira vitifoliae TaxID=58002 RepID=UPI0021A9AFB7|nr:14 kDa phosphohistidine phosphatase-like isoform X2 [Daktulosphaira vitifoliae]
MLAISVIQNCLTRFTNNYCLISIKLARSMADSSTLKKIPDVELDNGGRYKYILVKVTDHNNDSNLFKYVVHGGRQFEYHADIYDHLKKTIKPVELNVTTKMMGGGWVEHGDKSILVEGASVQYGPADHNITVEILKKKYPDYQVSCNVE